MNQTSAQPNPAPVTPQNAAGPAIAGSGENGNRPYVPDNGKQTAPRENMSVLLGGGGILVAVLFLAFTRLLHPANPAAKASVLDTKKATRPVQNTDSKIPITDSGQSDPQNNDRAALSSDDIARTAIKRPEHVAANLGAIPPFDSQQPWQPAGFQANGLSGGDVENNVGVMEDKAEKDALEKASLVYVRTLQPPAVSGEAHNAGLDIGIGLPPGTKLRARIEAAVSTAVQTPVLAVVEYNYEKNGEIIVPAGAKAFGHLEAADATGYVNVRFDSLLMPDGGSVPIEGAATDLRLRPIKGKVEGKHAGKNILVRSFAGLGEITATLAGRGSLGQPLSEGDLIRERAANNIAQASDEQIASLAITQRIVVTVPANTEIYVVLGKPATITDHDVKSPASHIASSSTTDQLRQLLQLQRELNQQTDPAAKQ